MPARQKSEFYECQHIRPSGKKCAAIAIRGHRFCYFHLQMSRLVRDAHRNGYSFIFLAGLRGAALLPSCPCNFSPAASL
jgi:hypothetical protein